MSQSRRIKLTVGLLLTFIVVLVAAFAYRMGASRTPSVEELQARGLYLLETPRDFGQVELVDHLGTPFTAERFQGRWSLVFFGFTYCPDICPTTMAFLDQFVSSLDPAVREQTRVVMVTVDPARDTVAQLADYVPYFNQSFVGLTGDFMQIHRFATALNTPFRKVPGGGADYLVDHSANVVLINPRGHYHGFFRAPLDKEAMEHSYRAVRVAWGGR